MAPRNSVFEDAPFEDIIDGYFPLAVSIHAMMLRRSLQIAELTLSHVPIMYIPDLAAEAPVPLNISSGRAGMIEIMQLQVQRLDGSCILRGTGNWRWLDGTPSGDCFDPMTRLAEPAFLQGRSDLNLPDGPKSTFSQITRNP